MKPLNLDNRPCSPISSNCVIWQGPELTCINLCKGDTISDVVANLATELCNLLDQTNVSNYDLTCLGITACGPADFQALIKLLIEKICELQGLPTNPTKSDSTCPDCTVTVASCFIQNGQTTMQLIDYVNMIAERVCALVSQINDLQAQINDLTIRVEILENTPPPVVTVPKVIFSCPISTLIPGQPYPVDVALQTYINDVWCPMADALGTPSEILSAIEQPCEFGTDVTSNPNWIANPTSLADSINNIWITLCELYSAISGIGLTVEDTNSIDLDFTAGVLTANIADTGWQYLEGFSFYQGAMANSRPQCRRIGNQIHFRGTAIVPLTNGAGSFVPLLADNTYINSFRVGPYVGSGGMIFDADGRILFNSDGSAAQSVIPTSVLSAGTNLDNQYNASQLLGIRKIQVEEALGSGVTGSIALTAAVNVSILSNKTLRITPLNTIEQETTDLISFAGSSLLRNITSSFVPRSRVIDFRNFTPNIDGNMSVNTVPLVGGALLSIGKLYRIISFTPGDDFTNIGAANNFVGTTFIATGTTPTTWVSSQLIEITSAIHVDGFYNAPSAGAQWPAILDAPTNVDTANGNNLGGFAIRLDGLIAYIDPCTTDIKPYGCGKG